MEDKGLTVPPVFAVFVFRKGLPVAVRKNVVVFLEIWCGLSFLDSLCPVVLVKAILCKCRGGHQALDCYPKGGPDLKGRDEVLTACEDASDARAFLRAIARCCRDECDEARAVIEVTTRKAVVIRVQASLAAGAASKVGAPCRVIVEWDPQYVVRG